MEDHQLKSLIYRLEKTESKPKISVCPENKNNIVRVCVNPKCKTEENALICGTIECQCEKKNHSSCKIFLNYAYFKSIIREYNEKIKKVYNPIFASLKSIIEELTKLHNKLQ